MTRLARRQEGNFRNCVEGLSRAESDPISGQMDSVPKWVIFVYQAPPRGLAFRKARRRALWFRRFSARDSAVLVARELRAAGIRYRAIKAWQAASEPHERSPIPVREYPPLIVPPLRNTGRRTWDQVFVE